MSFSETIFLFVLALIVFGPKKLPEIARQAGKLLAELRRASNEFKSQIDAEIAHLEVQKSQTVLPPSSPPAGSVASLSLNPATPRPTVNQMEPGTPATLAAQTMPEAGPNSSVDVASTPSASSTHSAADPEIAPTSVPAAQDSHV
jgi:sec-independent protein translocase protein TatB